MTTFTRRESLLTGALLVAGGVIGKQATPASAAVKAAAAAPYQVLVFSKTAGFRHDSIPAGIEAIKKLGAENHFDVVAKALGMTADELHTALDGGKSIAAIAKDKGIDVAKIADALVADLKVHLDADVKAGKLTQAQADQMLANCTARISDFLNGTAPAGGPGDGGPGGRGGFGGPGHHGGGPGGPDGQSGAPAAGSGTTGTTTS